MIIVPGSASPKLASRIAEGLGCGLIRPELARFPDGETYARIPGDLRGEHAVIVQSTCHPQNENLIELFLLLDAAKGLGARRVTAAVPYFGYARQDRRFKPGEAMSAHAMCRLMGSAGADDMLTVDIHEEEIVRGSPIPAKSLTAAPLLGRHIARLGLKDALILGADEGALKLARDVAAELGADHSCLRKRRLTPTMVVTEPECPDVAGRDVVIVDDIISTGGTMIEAATVLKERGAEGIYAFCIHPVFADEVEGKILAAGVREVIATDTIEHRASAVSVAPLFVEALREGGP